MKNTALAAGASADRQDRIQGYAMSPDERANWIARFVARQDADQADTRIGGYDDSTPALRRSLTDADRHEAQAKADAYDRIAADAH